MARIQAEKAAVVASERVAPTQEPMTSERCPLFSHSQSNSHRSSELHQKESVWTLKSGCHLVQKQVTSRRRHQWYPSAAETRNGILPRNQSSGNRFLTRQPTLETSFMLPHSSFAFKRSSEWRLQREKREKNNMIMSATFVHQKAAAQRQTLFSKQGTRLAADSFSDRKTRHRLSIIRVTRNHKGCRRQEDKSALSSGSSSGIHAESEQKRRQSIHPSAAL